jgi:hypothetical protein
MYALSKNKRLLLESLREFQDIVNSLKKGTYLGTNTNEARHKSFTMKWAAKLVHHAKYRYNINKTMHQEIDFFQKKLQPLSGITWETPIAHIIPRIPMATAFGDSCLEGVGGYSISLGYCWHLPFPEEVIQRTLIQKKDNKDGLLILINVLEFLTVIIKYCASLHVFTTKSITNDLHPFLLNVTGNTSALSWTNHTCRKSKLGRLLPWFFCSLLIGSPLGINSQWISTDDNKIADNTSQIKKTLPNILHSFDYSSLCQMYLELTHCSFFQIQRELILLMWDIVLTNNWPTHEEVQILKRKPLHNLITSNGQE